MTISRHFKHNHLGWGEGFELKFQRRVLLAKRGGC